MRPTQPTFQGPSTTICGCGLAYKRMWFRVHVHKNTIQTSNKNFNLDVGMEKRTETRIGMEGSCITHSCIPLYTVYLQHIIIISHSGGMQEWVIQLPSIPILVSVLFSIPTSKIF